MNKIKIHMVITWHGGSAIKIVEKEVTVIVNPHGIKELMSKTSANLALLGNKETTLELVKDDPFVISKPGEYESKGVFVYGVSSGKGSENVLFIVDIEGLTVGVLGGMSVDQLNAEQMSIIEGVDVLCVPVGGGDVLNAKQAVKIINQIEPRIVIPFEYNTGSKKIYDDGVEPFLKEYGASKAEKLDKLKITKKDLPSEDTKVFIVEAS